MNTTRDDRTEYLDLSRINLRLSIESRGMHAVAEHVTTDPVLKEYADRRTQILRSHYEAMGVELGELAAEVKDKTAVYFALLTGDAS